MGYKVKSGYVRGGRDLSYGLVQILNVIHEQIKVNQWLQAALSHTNRSGKEFLDSPTASSSYR